jgi:micrococcal nuclease
MKKILSIFVILAFALPLQAQNILKFESVKVLSVVDGDTLKVNYNAKEESVRLIGIDAPESRINKKAKQDAQRSGEDLKTITAMGKEATNYVKTLVQPGDIVKIEFDVQRRDKYGRLLAYVYLSDGKMLNEEIVKAGYADLMTIPPDVKYQERFLKAYREARENKRGLLRR